MIDSETETLIESKNVRLLLISDVAKIPVNIVRDEIINGMGLHMGDRRLFKMYNDDH